MAFAIPLAASAAGALGATGTAASLTAFAASHAALLAGLSGLTTAFGALKGFQGAKYSAKATENASKYNAAVATNNAILARRNAELAGQEGEQATALAQQQTKAKVGAIKAAQAASGVDVNYGSAVDVRSSAAETGQLSALSLRSDAARKAYGYQTQAKDYDAQAGLDTATGKSARIAGGIEADSTLLGGLASSGQGYSNYLENKTPLSLSG